MMMSDDDLDELIIRGLKKQGNKNMNKKEMIKRWNNIYFEYRRLGDNLQIFYKEIILPIKKDVNEDNNEIEFVKEQLEDE